MPSKPTIIEPSNFVCCDSIGRDEFHELHEETRRGKPEHTFDWCLLHCTDGSRQAFHALVNSGGILDTKTESHVVFRLIVVSP